MPSPFDTMKHTVFKKVQNTMGVDAAWLPVGSVEGAEAFTAKVLFSNPTERMQKFGGIYDAEAAMIEYFNGDFPGLLERVENRGNLEIITIEGQEYMVKTVMKKHDGDTFLASVQIKIDA